MKKLQSSFLFFFARGIVVALLAVMPMCVAAQEDVESPQRTYHWSFGINAGIDRNYHSVDMSYMSDMKFDKYAAGSAFGISIGYAPLKWLSVNTGVVFIQKNYHMDHVFDYSTMHVSLPTTTTNEYLDIPLELKFSFGQKVKVHVFGGGYYGYWLKSHREGVTYSFSNEKDNEFDEDVEFNEKRDNRVEYGFTYGGGISGRIRDRIEIGGEVRWYYAVTDIQKPYMRFLNPRYNTTFAVTVGVSYWL